MRYVSLVVAFVLVVSASPLPVDAHDAPQNDPPLVDAGLDQAVDQGTVVWLDGGGSVDPDGELTDYEWSIRTPDGTTMIPADPDVKSTTFTASEVGRYVVTLVATDDHGATRSDSLYVDVSRTDSTDEISNDSKAAPNEPPIGRVSGPDTVVRGETATFTADVYDPDGAVVSYAWSNGKSSRDITRTVDLPVGQTFSFSVRVTDDDGATSVFRTSVRVRSPGDSGDAVASGSGVAPSALIDGPDRVAVGETASFVLRTSDVDGYVVSGEWTAPISESGMVLHHVYRSVGEHTVRATVVDDDGRRTSATKTVTVYDEGPPVATLSGPDTSPAGSTQKYTLEAFDPDGGEVTIRWTPRQDRLEHLSSRFVNHVTIEGGLGDVARVSATVTDDEGNTVTVVKETQIQRSIRVGDSTVIPTVSAIHYKYHTDKSGQTTSTDSVEMGTYDFSTSVSYEEGKLVRVSWEFNDSTTMSDTLGRFTGIRTSAVRHTFLSETGGKISRSVVVTATDADGDSTSQKWISRVHSIATHDDVVFQAFAADSTAPETHLRIEPGDRVDFRVGSLQNYKIEFGDGTQTEGAGTPRFVELSHVYQDPGTYTTRLFSSQGPAGKAVKTVRVTVQPSSYREYWYQIESREIERVVSRTAPDGSGWDESSIHDSGRAFTGRTREIATTGPRPSFTTDDWVLTGTTTRTRTRKIFRTRTSDPDGSGDSWRLTRRNVRSESTITYRDQYRWLDSKFRNRGWRFTGETRTRKRVHGDGHDHDRTRHTRTVRGSCTNWDLEVSPWGGFSRSCSRYSYDTEVWYSGHDHDGWTDWDKDYRFHREVAETATVWYHEYVGTRTQFVNVQTYAETEEWVEWVWERRLTEPMPEYSLADPAAGTYIEGTVEVVEVRCGTKESHFDEVMC